MSNGPFILFCSTPFVNALYLEVHDKMDSALCDAKWMLEMNDLKPFLEEIK